MTVTAFGVVVTRARGGGNLPVNPRSPVRSWTPFGGFREPRLGREPGPDAVQAFTGTGNVSISTEG